MEVRTWGLVKGEERDWGDRRGPRVVMRDCCGGVVSEWWDEEGREEVP